MGQGSDLPALMTKPDPFKYFETNRWIIRLAVILYGRFPLSLRSVEDLLCERGIEMTHESVRFWWALSEQLGLRWDGVLASIRL